MKRTFTALLVAGLLAQPVFAAGSAPDARPARPAHGRGGPMKEALAKLPEDKADTIRSSMKASFEKNHALADEARQIETEKRDLLKAATFDKATFEKKQAEERALHAKMRANGDAAFADAVAGLTVEERTILADAMPRHGQRGPHHGGMHKALPENAGK